MNTEATTNVTTLVRGWKATRNMKCLDQEYAVGGTYKLPADVKLEMCETGFHFCQRQQDVLRYYPFRPEFVLLEVESIGQVVTEGDKSVTDELRVIRVVPREEYEFMEGNEIRYEDSDGYWWTREYDERGNLIRFENSDGYWWTREYDNQGNAVRYESSDGGWRIKEYDERGNEIRFEDSDGYWRIKEYDEKGNMVRFEDSDGYWRTYEYDDRGNMINSNSGRTK